MEENVVSDPEIFFIEIHKLQPNLPGKVLARKMDDIWVSARIIETEVYYGKGGILSHSLNKKTKSKCDIKILPGKAL